MSVTIDRAGEGRYTVAVAVHRGGAVTPVGDGGEFGADDIPPLPPIAVDGAGAAEAPLAEGGQKLFDLIARAGLEPAWTDAGRPPLLLDVRDGDLADTPWELLRDGGHRPFALRTAPAARARLPFADPPPPVGVPIRLLVVVDSPADDTVLHQADELEAIYEGLAAVPCGWQVEVLRGPEAGHFYRKYENFKPDILHLIGHAAPSWEGRAVVMQPPTGEWSITAEYLVTTLPEEKPRLVVLNACRTAESSNPVVGYARGLREALLDGGVAAVVAMQGDVASGPAAAFSRALYRGLADDDPLDVAVAEARATVGLTAGAEPRDWILPVLDMRVDPAHVLRQQRVIDPATVIGRHSGFEMVRHMVDRAAPRRRFHDSHGLVRPAGPGGLVFVTGERRVGKTILTRSCVVAHAVAGTPVVYVSLEGRRKVGNLDFLTMVVNAARRWLGPPVHQQCDTTRAALGRLFEPLTATAPPAGVPGGPFELIMPVRPTAAAEPVRPNGATGAARTAYTMVTDLLGTIGAQQQPVVLVLDGVGMVMDTNALLDGLLVPASQDEFQNLRVVVVEDEGALRGVAGEGSDIPIPDDRKIAIPRFERAEAGALAREYLARCRPDDVADATWANMRTRVMRWATERMDEDPPQLGSREIEVRVETDLLALGLAPAGTR